MKYSAASLRLLGFTRRQNHWNDFITNTLVTWYKFSADHSVSEFAWINHDYHRNTQGTTHGGALMTFMDYCMAAHVWDTTGGKVAWTVELNNQFIRPARITRWIFAEVRTIAISDQIELEGIVRVNDPTGMIVMKSFGKFTLPKELKMLDDDE